MSESVRFAARQAMAVGFATVTVAVFRPSQPFLAILAAFLLLARPVGFGDISRLVAAAWSGVAAGLILLSLFPQQPWLLFPAFAGVILVAVHAAARLGHPSAGLLVALGICAALPAGLIHPTAALPAGWDHGWNLTTGILAAAASFVLFPPAPSATTTAAVPAVSPFSARGALLVALTVAVAAWVAVVFVPSSSVVLVIAALTTAWSLGQPALPAHLGQKAAGALLGAALAVVFDSIVAGSGNSFGLFLFALMGIFAALAVCAQRWNPRAACFIQCGAMFAVAAPMLPAPDTSIAAAGTRIIAVLAGFATAALLSGFLRPISSHPLQLTPAATNRSLPG